MKHISIINLRHQFDYSTYFIDMSVIFYITGELHL